MIFWLWAFGLLILVLGFVALGFGYLQPAGRGQAPRWLWALALVPLTAAIAVIGWMAAKPVPHSPPPNGTNALPPDAELGLLLDGLEAKLVENPGDATGWAMLGAGRMQMGRYGDAAAAYARAAALQPDHADHRSAWGEALTMADGGTVSPAARESFRQALALDPQDTRARYYLALARDADGDTAGAIDDWLKLLRDNPADAPWAADLRETVRQRAAAAGIDISSRLPDAPRGPSAADIAAAEDMTTDDREAMIAGMVDGLEARLADNPDDLSGWQRLIRARMVLGERQKAAETLTKARRHFASQPDALAQLDAEGKLAGL